MNAACKGRSELQVKSPVFHFVSYGLRLLILSARSQKRDMFLQCSADHSYWSEM